MGLNYLCCFWEIEKALTQAPGLARLDFTKSFTIESDALGNGIGAVLMQDNGPIAYFSKQLHGRHLLSTYKEEMMAPYLSVQKWRHYLLGKHFLVKTDHASLKHLRKQRILTTARHRWLINLLEYDFAIEYKKGIENNAADALSGVNESNSSALAGPTLSAIKCQAISAPTPSWLATIIKRT